MLQTLGLKLGHPGQHPVGVSLLHRPIPEHAQHLAGKKHSTTTGPTKTGTPTKHRRLGKR